MYYFYFYQFATTCSQSGHGDLLPDTKFHCRQRAPVGIVLSSSGIQATTKCKYYDHIVLLYLESRRCRYRSIIFACFYLYVSVINLIDYSDIDKMMDINNEKC